MSVVTIRLAAGRRRCARWQDRPRHQHSSIDGLAFLRGRDTRNWQLGRAGAGGEGKGERRIARKRRWGMDMVILGRVIGMLREPW